MGNYISSGMWKNYLLFASNQTSYKYAYAMHTYLFVYFYPRKICITNCSINCNSLSFCYTLTTKYINSLHHPCIQIFSKMAFSFNLVFEWFHVLKSNSILLQQIIQINSMMCSAFGLRNAFWKRKYFHSWCTFFRIFP